MKIFKRLPRKFRAAVVFSVIFTLLFPFSLVAQTESQYKVPKNSLSYFLQNPTQSAYLETVTDEQTGTVLPPLTSVEYVSTANFETTAAAGYQVADVTDVTDVAETTQDDATAVLPDEVAAPVNEFQDFVAPAPENLNVKAVDSNLANEVSSAPKIAPQVATPAPAPAKPAMVAAPQYSAKVNMPQIATSSAGNDIESMMVSAGTSEEPVFSKVLARMQQNKANRVADAEKLGVVLPSQGGDVAAVSPSLSKIQQTLRTIMARQA